LPPGAEGLVVLDHFQGNRTPHTDPNARGVISGLTLKHGPAHLYRAMIEVTP
jgi:ribulose kinase